MSWVAIRAIVRKDLSTVLRNRGVRIPLLVTPIIVLVVLPVILVGGADILASSADQVPAGGEAAFQGLEQEATSGGSVGAGLTVQGQWAVFVLETFLAPLYLLVPLITATVIAADSFAGERERGTLEALLHTPTTDRELLAAKFLASWLPAVVVSTVGFIVYAVLANVLAWSELGRVFFPNGTWVLLAVFMAPGLAALGLGVMVIASSRVSSLQAAHQVGSLVVLPILVLLVAQITGLLRFGPGLVATMGAAVWLLALLLLSVGARSLRRQRLAQRI